MSRTNTGRPEFRLLFGYPSIEFERVGAPPRRVALDAGDPAPTLRGFAAEVARVGGRLTALLPEAEVWRGRVGAADATAVARRAAAAELGVAPAALELTFGPVRADDLRAAAAVHRRTLVEARAFLARAGLKPHRLSAAGAFPGFDGPPAFRALHWPAALDPIGGRRAGAAAGLAAAVALLVWLGPWRAEAPIPAAVAPAPIAAASTAPAAPAADLAGGEIAPRPRPADLRPPVPATRFAARPGLVTVGLAARNMPADVAPPPPATRRPAPAAALLAAPDLPRPRPTEPEAPASGAAAPAANPRALDADGPRPRPATLRAASAATAPTAAASLGTRDDRPRPRPAAPVAAAAPAVEPARTASRGGPQPRPAMLQAAQPAVDVAPIVLAALTPPAAASAGLAAAATAVTPPAPRPVAARPEPAKPVAAPAAAQPVRAAPAAAQPVRVARLQPPAQPVRAGAPTVRQARVQPQAQPVRQARVQPAPAQPARSATQARQSNLRGNSLALIGIFGGADGRHALVQLPNGATERVRAGDQFQGVQVTAVAADGVHLRAQGRDSVLRLPD